ncbi:hypothetical protein DL770_009731 [Monosporascus sp. CRB-9-2]|nr:hypothetical protein DL770_009731 [Monosporascus sp. CRB-9-2]
MSRPLVSPTAPSAKGKITCTCGRSFKTDNALQQHRRDSPLHSNAAETQTGTAVGRIPKASRGKVADGLQEKEKFAKQRYANFRNEETFPTFAGLPGENDIDLPFYDTVDGFTYTPRKHWCFLTEIMDVELFIRVRLIVKDKAGTMVPVAFHTDDRGTEFAPSQLRPGYTVAILYAQQHDFLDLTTGIRQEQCDGIKVDLFDSHYPKILDSELFSDYLHDAG